jgi:hypothetical protein
MCRESTGGSVMYPNRYVCSVLEEMRTQLKGLDIHSIDRYKSITLMMIEEAQSMVNRMEAAIEDKSDINKMLKKRSKLHKEVEKLKAEKEKLEEEKE